MTAEPAYVIAYHRPSQSFVVYRMRRKRVLGKAVMLACLFWFMLECAALAAEFSWLAPAQYRSPYRVERFTPIVPVTTCREGFEVLAGRCVPDCRTTCSRTRIAESQTTFRDAQGKTIGTATPQGEGTVRFRDAQGRTTGTATTDSTGTTHYYGPDGRSLGTSTGPARAPFPEKK
jgi:hypothetical protein